MKPVWIAVAFAAGITVGVVWARRDAPATPVVTISAAASATEAAAVRAPAPGIQMPVSPAAKTADASPPDTKAVFTPPASENAVDYEGYSEPIDIGPVFRKALDSTKAVVGVANPFSDALRAMERERRDDSWSYPMEAEIQNSLLADVSAGTFNVEHVECRATLCEIRLSAKSDQQAALQNWIEGLHSQPWGSRLYDSYSSMISDGQRVDQLLILRRAAKPTKAN